MVTKQLFELIHQNQQTAARRKGLHTEPPVKRQAAAAQVRFKLLNGAIRACAKGGIRPRIGGRAGRRD